MPTNIQGSDEEVLVSVVDGRLPQADWSRPIQLRATSDAAILDS